ncbi:Cloroperoxidase [Glarea lozoyensis ATCC 20868]|uniref:Cloroperoxidase n=1 Tax=Glarea lozoyensis (strain ATCC 20868 / MF5171) TaxID=1116229 RepID=S3D5I9_GLAL2|nr:Cloroperoxidase [Glarea lozoyensis ATCC 20868]EPE27336.1 Cloroperoxidase [Glarea lozoyensis ATCC 20868]
MYSFIVAVAVLLNLSQAFPGMAQKRNIASITGDRLTTVAEPVQARDTAAAYPPFLGKRAADVRSPCPGLNSLANHDICPRSGKGYTVPILTKCLKDGLNVGGDFALVVGTTGIGSNPNPLTLQFDLDQLDRHNIFIEHDASLSRADTIAGDNHSFNQTIWDTVLDYYTGMSDTSIPVAAKAKYNRVTTEAERDPAFFYGPVQFVLSYGETALYLSTMGDPITGVAPIEYVRALFEEERLPYQEGWKPTTTPTTLATLGAMVLELNAANGEVLPEGLILGESSLRAVFKGLDPITGAVLSPILQTISGLLGVIA